MRSGKVVSIIVLTSNASSLHTRKTIESVEKNTKLPYELFVLRGDKKHFGFSKDNNRLMKIAEGKYFVLLNDDCYVTEGWLEKIITVAESDQSIGLVGARLHWPDGQPQNSGVYFRYSDDNHYLGAVDNPLDRASEVDCVFFALVLIKRAVIEKVGYLDERFTIGLEDMDFCLRSKDAGFRIVVSDTVAIHDANTSTMSLYGIKNQVRSSIILYRKLGWSLPRLLSKGTNKLALNVLLHFKSNKKREKHAYHIQ